MFNGPAREETSEEEPDPDEILRNTVAGDFEEDTSPLPERVQIDPEDLDEEEIMRNTTLGMSDWEHDGIEEVESPQAQPQTPTRAPASQTSQQDSPQPIADEESEDGENDEEETDEEIDNETDSSRPTIRDMAKKLAETKHGRAMIAVGKEIAKPYWDFDQKGEDGKAYNKRRLMRKIGRGAVRGALGVGVGVTAAAVQAGISITDGKYKPSEGFASFAAGYAGGGQIVKGYDRLSNTYKEGYDGNDDGLKMDRAKKRWADDEKVREYNKKKYSSNKYSDNDREHIIGVQQKLLEQGITDKDKMDQCIKYMKAQNSDGWYNDDTLIQKARVLSNLEDDLASYGLKKAPTDEKDRNNYINAKARNDAEKQQYGNMLDELNKFRNANSKMK